MQNCNVETAISNNSLRIFDLFTKIVRILCTKRAFLRREGGRGGAFLRKTVFKNYPSPSPLAKKVPVNRGLRAVLAGAKGSRRFTSLSQIWCETFVKRQKQEKGLESPVDRGL